MSIRETMFRASKPRSGIALGGIGAGSLELRKDGIFTNCTIANGKPQFGAPQVPGPDDSLLFFLVRFQEQGRRPAMRMLMIDAGDHPAGVQLQFYTFPWISGVDRIDYEASYPFARLTYTDRDMPFAVELEAWHPFIPHDVKNSALPGVYFDFKITPESRRPTAVLLMLCCRHFPGFAVRDRTLAARVDKKPNRLLLTQYCDGPDTGDPTWGDVCLASYGGRSSWFAGWSHRHTFHERVLHLAALPNLSHVENQNALDAGLGRKVATHGCTSTVGVATVLGDRGDHGGHGDKGEKGGKDVKRDQSGKAGKPGKGDKKTPFTHTFALAWSFPNLLSDVTKKQGEHGEQPERRVEGHYYTNFFADAAAAAVYLGEQRKDLERRTRAFHADFHDSSAPEFVLEQVSSHLNTFSTSAWLTKAGDFGIQEGITSEQAWGPLATVDVGMYGSIMTAALFPELDRAMILAHRRLQFASGDVQHGIARNFGRGDGEEGVRSRLDLAPQYVLQALRHYFWTNDGAYLAEIWPSVKSALEYTRTRRDADGDGLPEMAGSNSTYDNFPMFGPASCIASQWIAALEYGAAAAAAAGDAEAAAGYRETQARAKTAFVEKLWNGDYFILCNDAGGATGVRDEGCLADQLLGQWAAMWCGMPDLTDRPKIERALRAILKRNFEKGWGLYNCRWPGDDWLHPVAETCWFDQANTNWTGVELGFAAFLIGEGLVKQGLQVVAAVDRRYRAAGRYFDHQEWGGHYYRAMAAWGIINALLGYAAKGDEITFAPALAAKKLRLFFAHGNGTGHFTAKHAAGREKSVVEVHGGKLKIATLQLGCGLDRVRRVAAALGKRAVPVAAAAFDPARQRLALRFAAPVVVDPANPLAIRVTGK